MPADENIFFRQFATGASAESFRPRSRGFTGDFRFCFAFPVEHGNGPLPSDSHMRRNSCRSTARFGRGPWGTGGRCHQL